jgi:hypothetical protein
VPPVGPTLPNTEEVGHERKPRQAARSQGSAVSWAQRLASARQAEFKEAHHFLADLANTNAERPFGSSAILGSFVASTERRRGGGEDPWLCDPGFRQVCPCLGMARRS